MKSKKLMAITLCIGILASGIGGPLTSYAKVERDELKKYDASLDKSMVSDLPALNLIETEPEVYHQENVPSDKITLTSEGEVLYQGTQSTLNPEEKDMYHIGTEEIKDMMQKGYTVEDIFEADKISNEIGIEPEALLEKKAVSNKSLEQIKKDILEECRETTITKLKEKYKNEYEKLKNKKLKESEIINLIAYADVNNIKISDNLIEEYQKNGNKVFEKTKAEINQSEVSPATKEKYQISDAEAKDLSEELVNKLEILSQKTGKSVDELMKGYLIGNSSKEK